MSPRSSSEAMISATRAAEQNCPSEARGRKADPLGAASARGPGHHSLNPQRDGQINSREVLFQHAHLIVLLFLAPEFAFPWTLGSQPAIPAYPLLKTASAESGSYCTDANLLPPRSGFAPLLGCLSSFTAVAAIELDMECGLRPATSYFSLPSRNSVTATLISPGHVATC